ncbi:MAG: hypothetical protein A2Y38_24025 [Spirochaetes bacterium GWB1_59_5]|nr:MAG: hypothetical protein A2Y38_24025 [Spirochaetes bacterium GWB1_59_5]
MTPERALELAEKACTNVGVVALLSEGKEHVATRDDWRESIAVAILAAVAAQMEKDAKICEAPITDGKIDVGHSVVSCCAGLARAIRDQEK